MNEKKKAKPKPPLYLTIRRVIDKETGLEFDALAPIDGVQRRALFERNFKHGARVRCVTSQERDYGQWKKAHLLGTLLVTQVEGFERDDSHGALKKIQLAGDIECDHLVFAVPGAGFDIVKKEPRSLAFDKMDETDFQRVYSLFCDYICAEYFPGMDEAGIESMIKLMPLERAP